jgi:hypothetical protein
LKTASLKTLLEEVIKDLVFEKNYVLENGKLSAAFG